jgi:hypothetical protein
MAGHICMGIDEDAVETAQSTHCRGASSGYRCRWANYPFLSHAPVASFHNDDGDR